MKENSSFSTPCENAAVRIQYWLGKDRQHLLCAAQSPLKMQDFSKKHKCDLVKTPRLLLQADYLPLQRYLSKRKRQVKQRQITKEDFTKALRFCLDLSHCSISQKNLNHLHSEYALSSARVAYCLLKEHLLASKHLKHMAKQKNICPRRHDVVPLKALGKQDLSHNPYLQEWQKIKEERHFQIGRVIKYFTD